LNFGSCFPAEDKVFGLGLSATLKKEDGITKN